jgi:hypothetical protein
MLRIALTFEIHLPNAFDGLRETRKSCAQKALDDPRLSPKINLAIWLMPRM